MRYLLFGGDDYYPKGGWDDLIDTGDDLDALRPKRAAKLPMDAMGGGTIVTEGWVHHRRRHFTSHGEGFSPLDVFDWFQIVDVTTGSLIEAGDLSSSVERPVA